MSGGVISADAAWRRMDWMRHVVRHQPAVAHAVSCLSLYDQLELTLEILNSDWPGGPLDGLHSPSAEPAAANGLPANVLAFRPRHGRRPPPQL